MEGIAGKYGENSICVHTGYHIVGLGNKSYTHGK